MFFPTINISNVVTKHNEMTLLSSNLMEKTIIEKAETRNKNILMYQTWRTIITPHVSKS
jgi:hypothetical protein